jgi:hypothetical protein
MRIGHQRALGIFHHPGLVFRVGDFGGHGGLAIGSGLEHRQVCRG